MAPSGKLRRFGLAVLFAGIGAPFAAGPAAGSSAAAEGPARFGQYYSGPPCAVTSPVDRTWSQFQVNLGSAPILTAGRLTATTAGGAILVGGDDRDIELLTNASRADWLLDYPLLDDGVAVWGRPILGPGCTEADGSLYVESLFPTALLADAIVARLDLMQRPDAAGLQDAIRRYRWALARHDATHRAYAEPAPAGHAADRLEKAIFERDAARDRLPWRVRLMGPEDPLPEFGTVDLLLSGGDGSVGVFGHISVGAGGIVYNIYPKGSERGAPDLVPLGDYLFNAQRGMALRRPTWILRLEGLPDRLVNDFDREMRQQVEDIKAGRVAYHPTQNNCTVASLKGLSGLGFEVARARYFTRRFPRPAFAAVLDDLPGLIASGRLPACRVELIYVPQVPTRETEGSAPNRPLRDRSRVG
ncbi:MAG TPA: hypothetical protein VGS03_07585 [Candidatus Polarisedimenticolia bacterium]|jgi:hypothetical protein|nr:hypothetical protein [Candidatus Polarisedimenticolia bacterium]